MRELAFRAWDLENKSMIHIQRMSFKTGQIMFYGQNIPRIDIETNYVMQYTGLKDKNGVKIYEGDILKSSDKIGSVRWMEEYLQPMIYSQPLNQYFYLFDCLPSEIEIVGNIYENPELVEVWEE